MFRQKCTSLSSQLLKIVTSQWFVQNDTHLARTLNANFLSSKWCLKYSVCTFLFSITMTKHGSICEHISETKENIELWQHFENLRPKQKNVPTLDTTLASDRLQPHVVCFMKIKTQMLREQNTDSLQQQSLKRWGVRRKIIFIHAKPSLSVSSRDGYQRQYYLYFLFFGMDRFESSTTKHRWSWNQTLLFVGSEACLPKSWLGDDEGWRFSMAHLNATVRIHQTNDSTHSRRIGKIYFQVWKRAKFACCQAKQTQFKDYIVAMVKPRTSQHAWAQGRSGAGFLCTGAGRWLPKSPGRVSAISVGRRGPGREPGRGTCPYLAPAQRGPASLKESNHAGKVRATSPSLQYRCTVFSNNT